MLSKCAVCGGEVKGGIASLVFDKNNQVIVVREIPAFVCQKCGEEYFDDATTEEIEKLKGRARASLSDVSLLTFKQKMLQSS